MCRWELSMEAAIMSPKTKLLLKIYDAGSEGVLSRVYDAAPELVSYGLVRRMPLPARTYGHHRLYLTTAGRIAARMVREALND